MQSWQQHASSASAAGGCGSTLIAHPTSGASCCVVQPSSCVHHHVVKSPRHQHAQPSGRGAIHHHNHVLRVSCSTSTSSAGGAETARQEGDMVWIPVHRMPSQSVSPTTPCDHSHSTPRGSCGPAGCCCGRWHPRPLRIFPAQQLDDVDADHCPLGDATAPLSSTHQQQPSTSDGVSTTPTPVGSTVGYAPSFTHMVPSMASPLHHRLHHSLSMPIGGGGGGTGGAGGSGCGCGHLLLRCSTHSPQPDPLLPSRDEAYNTDLSLSSIVAYVAAAGSPE